MAQARETGHDREQDRRIAHLEDNFLQLFLVAIHFGEGFDLGNGDRLLVAQRDDLVERENQLIHGLRDGLLIVPAAVLGDLRERSRAYEGRYCAMQNEIGR